MPTENERKYVLRVECEGEFKRVADSVLVCKQAYLAFSKGMSARVRETIDHINKSKYRFCFKQNVDGRVVEIEKKIDRRDFDDLWSKSLNRLEKLRYNLWIDDHLWEVDFFKDREHRTYFALAEHEMPEGQLEPDFIPEIIQKNLIYIPHPEDSHYSSKRLADVRYATRKYEELLHKWACSDSC